MEDIEAIIFDLGRVLVDIDNDRLVRNLSRRDSEIDANALLSLVEEDELTVQFDTGKLTPEQFYGAVCSEKGIQIGYGDFLTGYCDIFKPMFGIDYLIHQLKDKYTIGLLSNTNTLHYNFITGHFPYVDAIKKPTLSYKLGIMKPDEKIYQTAAENVGVDISKCLFIDDRQPNVDGAVSAGMQAFVFEGVDQLRKQLEPLL